MFVTFESTINTPTVSARHDTFAEAFNAIATDPACVMIEPDADNDGCADAYMRDGRLLCIEPAARRGL